MVEEEDEEEDHELEYHDHLPQFESSEEHQEEEAVEEMELFVSAACCCGGAKAIGGEGNGREAALLHALFVMSELSWCSTWIQKSMCTVI